MARRAPAAAEPAVTVAELAARLDALGPFERRPRLAVAVSGGPDSMALALLARDWAAARHGSILALIVDHGLRPESAQEAALVRERCRAAGVACEVVTVDVEKARRRHVSVQEAARNARLFALEQTASRLGCSKIALAHTADDQAETVLFRILRGTGIDGLEGIPYERGHLVRPLLDVRRAQVLSFLSKRKIPFISDPSNADRKYARARIRQDVLPMLSRENPRVVEALLGLSRQARARAPSPWREVLPRNLYLCRRVIDVVDRLVREGEGTRTVAVPGGSIVIRYGAVTWRPRADAGQGATGDGAPREMMVAGPGTYALTGAPVVEITAFTSDAWPSGNVACFDASKLAWPLVLRPRRDGDRMTPRAGRGSRKLADLIIDAKIPREERAVLPVLCDANGAILFVPGLRPSEAGRPDVSTREWFKARLAR